MFLFFFFWQFIILKSNQRGKDYVMLIWWEAITPWLPPTTMAIIISTISVQDMHPQIFASKWYFTWRNYPSAVPLKWLLYPSAPWGRFLILVYNDFGSRKALPLITEAEPNQAEPISDCFFPSSVKFTFSINTYFCKSNQLTVQRVYGCTYTIVFIRSSVSLHFTEGYSSTICFLAAFIEFC